MSGENFANYLDPIARVWGNSFLTYNLSSPVLSKNKQPRKIVNKVTRTTKSLLVSEIGKTKEQRRSF